MPDTIFSQIIPLTAAMALPFPVLKGTRLLLAGKPVAHSMIFILTWGIACFLALSAAVIWKAIILEFFGVFANYTLPEKFSGWVHIIHGARIYWFRSQKVEVGNRTEKRSSGAAVHRNNRFFYYQINREERVV